jgi:hypothetical protein
MNVCTCLKPVLISPEDVDEFSESLLLESLLSDVSLLESLEELWRFLPLRFLSFFDFLRESSLDFDGSWKSRFDSLSIGIEPMFNAVG